MFLSSYEDLYDTVCDPTQGQDPSLNPNLSPVDTSNGVNGAVVALNQVRDAIIMSVVEGVVQLIQVILCDSNQELHGKNGGEGGGGGGGGGEVVGRLVGRKAVDFSSCDMRPSTGKNELTSN